MNIAPPYFSRDEKTNEEVVSEDITDKTDDIVVRHVSYGSHAFNNSHTALLNNYGEGDEVFKPANDEEEKLVVCITFMD